MRTYNFLAPSLHPNTIVDLAIPESGPSQDPIVKHLAIKYGEHESIGHIKRIVNGTDGNVSPFQESANIRCR
jgi:ribosome biogenesis protein NSA1